MATLVVNEDVTVLNNTNFSINRDGKIVNAAGEIMNGYTVDNMDNVYDKNGNYIANMNPFVYEFIDNGEFTFEFVDKAGNKDVATAKVDWIDKEAPIASLEYDINNLTNKDVTVKIDKSNKSLAIVKIVNPSKDIFFDVGVGIYEFTMVLMILSFMIN